MDDLISRQAAISAICNACGKIDCDKMDKCEKLQLPPANSSEFPNNSDTISRQAAIDAVNGMPDCPNGFSGTYDKAAIIGILEDVPSVQPQRWIPVSEALPDDGVEVWVTIKGHDVITCEEGETLEQAIARISKIRWVTQGYWSEEEHGWNDPSFGCPLMVKPVAWMPMEVPDPWQGGQDD